MIDRNSFKSKPLKLFFKGDRSKIAPNHASLVDDILQLMDAGSSLADVDLPGLRLHPWSNTGKGKDRVYSLDISGNVRILFQLERGYFFNVEYHDPH